MKIAIATAGRFHVLDLARELHALGHEVKFYSYVPRARANHFGLPSECHVSLIPLVFPLIAWERFAPRLGRRSRERLTHAALDRAVMWKLAPCDVFICMSGIYLEAAAYAKRRFRARIYLERGSRHILSQDEILAGIPGAERPSPAAIRRELAGYRLADRIVIPSTHVEESFERDAGAHAKLFRNPYGVDLSMFPFHEHAQTGNPVAFLTAGQWSLRKGSNVLQEAIARLDGVRLQHVGAIVDLPFPVDCSRFEHRPRVPQWQLSQVYAQADAFVLASQEEGLSTVLAQALASGLPMICTDRTGGADLAHTPALSERITVVPHNDSDALAAAIGNLRDRLRSGWRPSTLPAEDREKLSWSAYARRYSDELQRDIAYQ